MARTSLSRYTMLVWLPGYLVVSIDLDRERRIRNWLLQQPLLISVNGLTYQHRLSLACPNPTLRLLEHDVKCHFRKNRCYFTVLYRSSYTSRIDIYHFISNVKNRISIVILFFRTIVNWIYRKIISIIKIPPSITIEKFHTHTHTFNSFKVYIYIYTLSRSSRHFDNFRRQLANISKLPLVNTRDADLPIFTLQLDTTGLSLFPYKISATQAVPLPFLFHGNTRCQVQGRLFVPLGLIREAKAISYLCLCESFHLPAEVAGSVSRLIVTVVVEVPKGSSRLQG